MTRCKAIGAAVTLTLLVTVSCSSRSDTPPARRTTPPPAEARRESTPLPPPPPPAKTRPRLDPGKIVGQLARGAWQSRKFKYKIKSIYIKSLNLKRIHVVAVGEVTNPLAFALTKITFQYKLRLNGVEMTGSTIHLQSPLPAKAKSTVSVDLFLGPADAVKVFARLIRGRASYRIEGVLTGQVGPYPVRVPFVEQGTTKKRKWWKR